MGPDEIREGLAAAARKRQEIESAQREASAEMVRWLRLAEQSNITTAEVARITGLTRNGVYYLLRHV